jgi:hypothetical protein
MKVYFEIIIDCQPILACFPYNGNYFLKIIFFKFFLFIKSDNFFIRVKSSLQLFILLPEKEIQVSEVFETKNKIKIQIKVTFTWKWPRTNYFADHSKDLKNVLSFRIPR